MSDGTWIFGSKEKTGIWLETHHDGTPYEVCLTDHVSETRPERPFTDEQVIEAVREATGFVLTDLRWQPYEVDWERDDWYWGWYLAGYEVATDPRISSEIAQEYEELLEDSDFDEEELERCAPSLLSWALYRKDNPEADPDRTFERWVREAIHESWCDSRDAQRRSEYEMDYYAGYE